MIFTGKSGGGGHAELDILYMTRVQRERFFNEEDYVRLKDSLYPDSEKLSLGKKDLAVMHPLPRVNEIAAEVDEDPRAVYFEQARNGVLVRMALILALLGLESDVLREGRITMLNIDSIENGIVIDHITAGRGMRVYELLELDKLDTCVAIIKNAKSNKFGRKDIIKIRRRIEYRSGCAGFHRQQRDGVYDFKKEGWWKEEAYAPGKIGQYRLLQNPPLHYQH